MKVGDYDFSAILKAGDVIYNHAYETLTGIDRQLSSNGYTVRQERRLRGIRSQVRRILIHERTIETLICGSDQRDVRKTFT